MRHVLVLCLFLPINALAGPRTEAAQAAVSTHKSAEATVTEDAAKAREAERKKLVTEIKALRAEITGYLADLEDIESAYAALVRGCVESPLVADWNAEIDAITGKKEALEKSADELGRRVVATRSDPFMPEVAARGLGSYGTVDRPVFRRGFECTTQPATLNDYVEVLATLRALDESLARMQAELDPAS